MASPQRNAAIEDARRLLANCILFRGLVENERDAVVARARLRRFAAGEGRCESAARSAPSF